MPKKLSERERQRRQHQAARDRQQPLLYTRQQVAAMYSISIASVIRLENAGRLKGLKLGPSKNHRTLYRAADVERIAVAGVEVA